MSPKDKVSAMSNVYTTLLALAVASVIATTAVVAYNCLTQYGTILQIIQVKH